MLNWDIINNLVNSGYVDRLLCIQELCYIGLVGERVERVKARAQEGLELCNKIKRTEPVRFETQSTLSQYSR